MRRIVAVAVIASAMTLLLVFAVHRMTSATAIRPSQLAMVIAKPLVPADGRGSVPGERLAVLSANIRRANELAERGGPLAPLAFECGKELQALRDIVQSAPSIQPLLRSGADVWRQGLDRNATDREVIFSMLGAASEFSKLKELMDKVEQIHVRTVACRLQVAEEAVRDAPPALAGSPFVLEMFESGVSSRIKTDTLRLTNTTDTPFTDVMVLTELSGSTGERFANLYFVPRWEARQTLLALFESDQPERETVRGITSVKVRVIANEGQAGPLLPKVHR